MAKRFTDTEIWGEDWFLDMPNEYKLFWYYMLSNCDHSGIYKVNMRSFCSLNEVKLTSNKVLEYFNAGKQRIRVLQDNVWLIEDFFVYQYGETFNTNNRVHESIKKVYQKYNIELTSIRGLKDHKDRVKDKDKDIDIDKDIDKENNKEKEKKEVFKEEKPDLDQFLIFCKEDMNKNGLNYQAYEYSLKSKFASWQENNWKDGNNKPIKSWKAKIRNTIPFLKPINQTSLNNGGLYQDKVKEALKAFKPQDY
jgi:hypothetical protein